MQVTDPETLKFIADAEAAYPADANTATAEENRRYYEAICAFFRRPRPEGVRVTNETLAGVPVRRCRPKGPETRPFLLYSHGGGWVVGSLDSHDDICAELAIGTGCEVVSVGYRLAPEHVYPAQIDDVAAVWQAETAAGRDGIAIGDSAGGNLSAGLCLRARRVGAKMPLAQVLIYPLLNADMTAASYRENAEAPLLRRSDLLHYRQLLTGSDEERARNDPEIWPLSAGNFAGLAPAFVLTADVDPLRDDGPSYVAALRAAGVHAEWRNEPQLVHGYLRARHRSQRIFEPGIGINLCLGHFAPRSHDRADSQDAGAVDVADKVFNIRVVHGVAVLRPNQNC